LDYLYPDRERLLDTLALGDEELMRALAGRRRAQLQAAYAAFSSEQLPRAPREQIVCRHDARFPAGLRFPSAPHALHASPSVERLRELTARPLVALVGSARASDYGMEVARGLARGLAAAGVTVTCGPQDGIAAAALAGALEADGGPVGATPGGVDVPASARRRSLHAQLTRRGCAVSELPCGSPARRWGQAASERVVVGLAQLTLVVEAADSPRELAPARLAHALGRVVAAVPGRVTSALSAGTNALLAGGASLVGEPADALELLCAGRDPTRPAGPREPAGLEPRLQRLLDQVSAGRDTPDKLARDGQGESAVLPALSELELAGLLARGDGGRYVPRAQPARASIADS
jgi:DNA processing protein